MTDKEREELKSAIAEYMEDMEDETETLRKKTAAHIAGIMGMNALQKHEIHEIGEYLDAYGRDDIEHMIKEYAELSIVMDAIRNHLSEGMWIRTWENSIKEYAKKYNVE